MIAGNEAEHIVAMLSSFKHFFDEFALVRAIGAKEPDATIELATVWCRENGKVMLWTDYQNGPGAERWDHVDSFANARNAAFKLGSGDWLIWADCDDVMEDASEAAAAAFRAKLAALPEGVSMVRCPYDVRGTNKKLHRAGRQVRRRSNEWSRAAAEERLKARGHERRRLEDGPQRQSQHDAASASRAARTACRTCVRARSRARARTRARRVVSVFARARVASAGTRAHARMRAHLDRRREGGRRACAGDETKSEGKTD